MTRVGLDIGFTTGGAIIWTVFADTNRYAGMLNGTYAGASAEMSVAAGLGANVLVGGSQSHRGAAAGIGPGANRSRHRRRHWGAGAARRPLKSGGGY